jgi:hypothetical protein
MFKTLLDKVKVWWNNKQEEAYPLTPDIGDDAPDTSEDTAREVETPKDKVTSLFSWTFKF